MINCYVYLFLLVFLYSLCSVSFLCLFFALRLPPTGSHTDSARLALISVVVVVFLFIQNLITTYLLPCVCRC